MNTTKPLPEEFEIPVVNIGYFLSPLKSNQAQLDAGALLDAASKANDRGAVLGALHAVRLAYQRDIKGNHMERRINVTVVHAEQLIAMIEARDGAA